MPAWTTILLFILSIYLGLERHTTIPSFLLFEMGSCGLFCRNWHKTVILLISACAVARIAGVSHHTWLISFYLPFIFMLSILSHSNPN
jgi:hypothetical protein